MSDIAALVAGNLDIWTSATQGKSGAGRGGGKRISLYGIERLRALILDLAVRGKLVPQDAGDEPASKLLSKLEAVKAKYLSEHGLPKLRALAGAIEHTPFELPPGWAWARLGEIAAYIQRGKSPKYSEGTGIYVISQRCVQWTGLDLSVAKEISRSSLEAYEPYRFLKSDDLLWNSTGTGTIGRVIALSDVPDGLVCDSHVTLVRCPWVNARYLQSWLASDDVYGQIEVRAAGSTNQIEWTAQLAASQLVPLPPLAEQRRIVAKVDELMALCDALERESVDAMAAHLALVEELLGTLVNSADATDLATNWARLETHFDTLFITDASIEALKQTILDLAVRGKLVEQDAGDEAASLLVKQTMASKLALVKQGKTKRDKPLPKVKTTDAPFELPGGWAWARFPELGIFERGKSKHRPRNDPKLFKPGIYPLVQTGEVARSDGVIQEFHSEYSEIGLAQSKLWPAGTLCITIAANIADVATLGFDACFPDSVVGFIPSKPITNPQYFLYFMKTAKADLLKFAPSTAQKNINLGILETVLIPLPPLAEQNRIVAKVDALMALCDQLKTRLADAAQTQRHLADAITERAAA